MKKEYYDRDQFEKERDEQIQDMNNTIIKENNMRNEANVKLQQVIRKFEGLEDKYKNEIWYNKEVLERKDVEISKLKDILKKITERVLY